LLLLLAAVPASGTDGERPVKTPQRIPRIENTISVDGVLDEPVWERALVMGVNNEVRPGYNIPAPVETDMLLAYSETHFYVAFRAEDPDPGQIYAHLCDHDEMWDDEWVVIGIDTYNDQRGGYEFACNPLGIQGDTASGIHGDGNAWDGLWDSAGRIFDWGYSVEMAIPFSTLRFQRVTGDQIWGVDAVRSYPREVRHHISLYPRDRDDNCYRCQMDKLVGFEGATPGRNIEITPTVSVVASQLRDNFPTGDFPELDSLDPESDVGVTAKWGVTPNVTLTGAYNPDFSQVEADAFQLDVNRQFALWYEEKRPFFLESAGAFDNFYSRSIASPIWAGKVTAKAGDNTFGVLAARDELTNLIISGSESSGYAPLDMESTAAALRYARDIGDMSNVSTYFNAREGDGYHNRVAGADVEVWFNENATLSFQGETSVTQYPDEITSVPYYGQSADEISDESYEIQVGRYTSGLDVYANYSDVGKDFRTDLAFMPRVGYKHVEAGAGHTWQRESGSWWTMLNFGGCYNYQELQNGTKFTRGTNIWINHQGPKQSDVDIYGWVGTKVFAGKEFETWEFDVNAGFWPSSSLYAFTSVSYGEEVDYDNVRTGREFIVSPRAEFKLGRGLSTELGYDYERFTVDGDELYAANVARLKAVYQFSRRMFVRGILQYSRTEYNTALYTDSRPDLPEEESHLSSQVLLSYKINPQTVFFLGYSDSHDGDQDIDLTQRGRTVFAKIGYAWVL
jgi:hypothetical protein